ncbi:MAG: Bax inhibitor-1/YccA family protein [Pseudomonadota bacterium]
MANPTLHKGQIAGAEGAAVDAGLQAHMNKVYALMAGAMIITGLFAYVFGSDLDRLVDHARQFNTLQGVETLLPVGLLTTLYSSPFVYVLMFAPLAFCFFLAPLMMRASVGAAQICFWAFAAIMGLSLATIFVQFTSASIGQAFFATAASFGALSIYGYTTQRDLSGFGVFLLMGLLGAIVLSVLNWAFFGFEAFSMAMQMVVLLASAGLTAYFTQQIKNDYLVMREQPGSEQAIEMSAIFGALNLYISFVNIFISLLSLFGSRE